MKKEYLEPLLRICVMTNEVVRTSGESIYDTENGDHLQGWGENW